MKAQVRPQECDVIRFGGQREAEILDIEGWLSSHDILNCEVTLQGKPGKYALDVTTEAGIITVEAGDWLVIKGSNIYVEPGAAFEENYEIIK